MLSNLQKEKEEFESYRQEETRKLKDEIEEGKRKIRYNRLTSLFGSLTFNLIPNSHGTCTCYSYHCFMPRLQKRQKENHIKLVSKAESKAGIPDPKGKVSTPAHLQLNYKTNIGLLLVPCLAANT